MYFIANQLLNLCFAGWLWLPMICLVFSARKKLIFPIRAKLLLGLASGIALLGQMIGYPHLFGIPIYQESPENTLWMLFFTALPLFLLLFYLGIDQADRPRASTSS